MMTSWDTYALNGRKIKIAWMKKLKQENVLSNLGGVHHVGVCKKKQMVFTCSQPRINKENFFVITWVGFVFQPPLERRNFHGIEAI